MYSFEVDFEGAPRIHVGEGLFGVNFIAGHDSLSGTYSQSFDQINFDHIRFPGGEVTEKYFDLLSPDDFPLSHAGTTDGLSKYIEFANDRGVGLHIVIPTKRYADNPSMGEEHVRQFIEKLESGEYGVIGDYVIEIGNEYYGKRYDYSQTAFTASIYGDIASKFATAIRDTSDGRASVAVQMGRRASEDSEIRNFFQTPDTINSVDLLIAHAYPWREDSIEGRLDRINKIHNDWMLQGIDAGIYLSEWNIGSSAETSKDHLRDYGLSQASAIAEFFEEMVRSQYELASIWALQQNNKTSLFTGEGKSEWRVAGHTIDLFADRIQNGDFIDQQISHHYSTAFDVRSFETETGFSIFISNNNDVQNTEIMFGMDKYKHIIESYNITNLRVDGSPEAHNATPVVFSNFGINDPIDSGNFVVKLPQEHEMAVVDLTIIGTAWSAISGYSGSARLLEEESLQGNSVKQTFESGGLAPWDIATRIVDNNSVTFDEYHYRDGVINQRSHSDGNTSSILIDKSDVYSWSMYEVSATLHRVRMDDGAELESLVAAYGRHTEYLLNPELGYAGGFTHISANSSVVGKLSTGEIYVAQLHDDATLQSLFVTDVEDDFDWHVLAEDELNSSPSNTLESDQTVLLHSYKERIQNDVDQVFALLSDTDDLDLYYNPVLKLDDISL